LEEAMTDISPTPRESIVDPLVELARCSKQHRIIVAGSKGPELMFQLYRRGYRRVATTATCGLPDGLYDVALVDWQEHSVKALATTLDWLAHFLTPSAVLVTRVGSREAGASRKLASMLEKLGFRVEAGTRCAQGLVVSARRRDAAPKALAA
jgi:hypothetical protein